MPQLTGEPILEVASLRKEYGAAVAVEDVSFAINQGDSLAIVGESGSGKTTVARMITGLTAPTSGTIRVCGRDRTAPGRSAKERRRRGEEVQIVFQDPYGSLDPRQTATDALMEALELHTKLGPEARTARIHELQELVSLDERQMNVRPRKLSGGQCQRIAIARSLAAEPEILILDESVAALDVAVQAQILNLLADLRERTGITYVLISHDLAVVRQITEQVVVMNRGQIVEAGRTGEVLDNPQHAYTRALLESVPRPGWRPKRRDVPPEEPQT